MGIRLSQKERMNGLRTCPLDLSSRRAWLVLYFQPAGGGVGRGNFIVAKHSNFRSPPLLNSKLSSFYTPALSFLSLTPRHAPLVINTSRPARAYTNLHPSPVEPRPVLLISISAPRTSTNSIGVPGLGPEHVRTGVPGGSDRYSIDMI